MSPPISEGPRSKPITRRTLLSRRDALTSAERASASALIAHRAAAELAPFATVAIYAPKGSEVDTAELDMLLRARGTAIAYPRVIDEAKPLAFHAALPGELVPARFGLREPRLDAPEIELAAIDAFVIPGLAFDRSGGRLGWGRGHYDATLAAAPRARRFGLAFECQVVDQVAREAHDILLHAIITELATHAGAP